MLSLGWRERRAKLVCLPVQSGHTARSNPLSTVNIHTLIKLPSQSPLLITTTRVQVVLFFIFLFLGITCLTNFRSFFIYLDLK